MSTSRPGTRARVRMAVVASWIAILAAGPAAAEEQGLEYSRSGGYVGLGGTSAVDNFSGVGSYDDSGSILFRAGYRGLPNVAVDFLGEVLPKFESNDPGGGDVDGFAVTVNLKLLLPLGRLEPYASVGFGVLDIDRDDEHREDDFAFRSAVGLDLYLTPRWALYGEMAYMLATGDVSDYDYATYGAGFLFRF